MEKQALLYTRDGEGRETAEQPAGSLSFLYRTLPGRMCLSVLTQPAVSQLAGMYMSSPLSKGMIAGFVRRNKIDMRDYEARDYRSFNDFFTRKVKPGRRPFDPDPRALIAPADARLSAYTIDDRSVFFIKGTPYSVATLLRDRVQARAFRGGTCLIFRLTVGDYHRYCFFDDGVLLPGGRYIPGVLHTVNPVALGRYDIYKENSRAVTPLRTRSFGYAVQVEVGAMLVGRICNVQTHGRFARGQEKGYFEYGGSTIVLLLQKGAAELRPDVVRNTADGVETRVRQGERIGHAKRK